MCVGYVNVSGGSVRTTVCGTCEGVWCEICECAWWDVRVCGVRVVSIV